MRPFGAEGPEKSQRQTPKGDCEALVPGTSSAKKISSRPFGPEPEEGNRQASQSVNGRLEEPKCHLV